MRFGTDRRGTLWVSIERSSWIGLLPVTKVEFESFLCARPAAGGFDDAWYADKLERNPRVPWHETGRATLLGTFMTALKASEAEAYCRWLGPGFHLPRWRDWLRTWKQGTPEVDRARLARLSRTAADPRYAAILERLSAGPDVRPLRRAMLMGDLLELVDLGRGTWSEAGSLPEQLPPNYMRTHVPEPLLTDSDPRRGFRVACADAGAIVTLDG